MGRQQAQVASAAVLQLLRPKAAAAILAISPRKLWSLTACAEIPAVRIGRAVRYDVVDLMAWVARHKGGAR